MNKSVLCVLLSTFALVESGFAQQTIFHKYHANPIFNVGSGNPVWRREHVANATMLKPSETNDGKWRFFLRGSGNNPDGYHDNIGMFDQNASSFNPYGPWREHTNNPNLKHGSTGYDAKHVLDGAAVSNVIRYGLSLLQRCK